MLEFDCLYEDGATGQTTFLPLILEHCLCRKMGTKESTKIFQTTARNCVFSWSLCVFTLKTCVLWAVWPVVFHMTGPYYIGLMEDLLIGILLIKTAVDWL